MGKVRFSADEAASKIAKQGILANWDDRPAARHVYGASEIVRRGGNVTCHPVTFVLPGAVRLQNLSSDRRLFSPNGDAAFDSVAFSFTLDRAAPVTAKVFASVNGTPGATPVRTIFTNAQQLEGQNGFGWDGKSDVGAPVPDGAYVVVVSAQDACSNLADARIEVVVDNTPPDAGITSPAPGATVGVVADVRGSAEDVHFKRYILEVGVGSAPASTPLPAAPRR
jgi:hypothetical protein